MSALSSNNLDKYEYLTCEDLGLKPSTVEQAKFEYSPLGKIFKKGLSKEDKKEGLLKRLKNIDEKNNTAIEQRKKQLEEIKDSKLLKTISSFSTISEKAKKLIDNIKKTDGWFENAQLFCTNTDGKTKYEFNKFMLSLKFTMKIHHYNLTLQKAKDDQQKLQILINKLNNNYNPASKIKIKEKDNTLKSAKILYFIKNDIIDAFQKGADGFHVEKETDEDIDDEMDTTIMAKLESQESAAVTRNHQGQGVKLLTPNQMLSRLPISLAQLKAGNNSEKLKNEIRQLLYSLYHSKNITKQVYNNLMKPI